MTSTVLYMSMSLDGFVAGPNERSGNGLGDGGQRLHDWGYPEATGVNAEVVDEFMSTGAVVAGAQTFELAGGWGGDHHDGVPIFIWSRHEPGPEVDDWPLVTYTGDLEDAMRQARDAAGDRNVMVHGVGTAQRALADGLLDEISIHLVPILLGDGRRLFEHLGADLPDLEQIGVIEGEGVTHLRYRVRR